VVQTPRYKRRARGENRWAVDSLNPVLHPAGLAEKAPDREQPWGELGLKADEYARIKEILERRPTSSELAMYSVMWSEHCSYKSSKVHLRQFAEIPQETPLADPTGGDGVGKMRARSDE